MQAGWCFGAVEEDRDARVGGAAPDDDARFFGQAWTAGGSKLIDLKARAGCDLIGFDVHRSAPGKCSCS